MEHTKLTELLHQVASGDISVEKAALELKTEPFEDLGFAKLDHHRKDRSGSCRGNLWCRKNSRTDTKDYRSFSKKKR